VGLMVASDRWKFQVRRRGKGTCVPPDFPLRTISNSGVNTHIVR